MERARDASERARSQTQAPTQRRRGGGSTTPPTACSTSSRAASPRVRLAVDMPRAAWPAAIALVGRTGDEVAAPRPRSSSSCRSGGPGGSRSNPASYSRMTAVLINADTSPQRLLADARRLAVAGRRHERSRWRCTDFTTAASDEALAQAKRHGVSPGTAIRLTFDEGLGGISSRSVRLLAPGGHTVGAALTQSQNGRIVVIRPSRPLSPARRYTVKLTGDVTDVAATPCARAAHVAIHDWALVGHEDFQARTPGVPPPVSGVRWAATLSPTTRPEKHDHVHLRPAGTAAGRHRGAQRSGVGGLTTRSLRELKGGTTRMRRTSRGTACRRR